MNAFLIRRSTRSSSEVLLAAKPLINQSYDLDVSRSVFRVVFDSPGKSSLGLRAAVMLYRIIARQRSILLAAFLHRW